MKLDKRCFVAAACAFACARMAATIWGEKPPALISASICCCSDCGEARPCLAPAGLAFVLAGDVLRPLADVFGVQADDFGQPETPTERERVDCVVLAMAGGRE